MSLIKEFKSLINQSNTVEFVRSGLIGDDIEIKGPFGQIRLIYADYVASGRALDQVEDFIRQRVLPYYANSHTEASYCGSFMTELRKASREEVARMTGAGQGTSVVFTGAGSTSAINRLVSLLDLSGIIDRGKRALVLVGPYEHHSNLLPWRESGAEVIEIQEGSQGGPCKKHLIQVLKNVASAEIIVGAFSAASNVTGFMTDVNGVTSILKTYSAIAIWDYGCGAPYMSMSMKSDCNDSKDAIVFSPHKFLGGPGASGVMIVRDAVVRSLTPSLPGGGTVNFVSPWGHTYSDTIQRREEGGTPNILGDIRVALAMLVKEALGQDWIECRNKYLRKRASSIWEKNPRLEFMGGNQSPKLPIFSFRVRDGNGGYVHHQFFTRLLSDVAGVQARGGCACAGAYAHRLLGINQEQSDIIEQSLKNGNELEKPGWIRLNFSAIMTDEKVDQVISAVDDLALSAMNYQSCYHVDAKNARFIPIWNNINKGSDKTSGNN